MNAAPERQLDPRRDLRTGRRPRVVLLAEQRLVGDAVRVALDERGLGVLIVPWPDNTLPIRMLRRQVAAFRPSIGLVFGDIADPGRRELTRWLVTTVPLRWVLVVSDPDDPVWGELVVAGVHAVLSTSISLDDLSRALQSVVAGVDIMSAPVRDRSVKRWLRLVEDMRPVEARMDTLTPREREVLDRLAHGVTVRQIAVTNEVSEGTVRTQVKSILRKLEVTSQIAAVAAYHQHQAHTHPRPAVRRRREPAGRRTGRGSPN